LFQSIVQINVLIDTGSSNFAIAASPDLGPQSFFNASGYVDLCYICLIQECPQQIKSWDWDKSKTFILKTETRLRHSAFKTNTRPRHSIFSNSRDW